MGFPLVQQSLYSPHTHRGMRGPTRTGAAVVSILGGPKEERDALGTSETFCTECQRVAYVAEGTRLECPVCASPLLATIEETDPELTEDVEGLSAAG